MNSGNGSNNGHVGTARAQVQPEPERERNYASEEAFHRTLALERKRTERSRKPFVLMLVETRASVTADADAQVLERILRVMSPAVRDTDVAGWYKNGSVVGVLFTDLSDEQRSFILETMFSRVCGLLRGSLTLSQLDQLTISFHVFPEAWTPEIPRTPSNPTLYPDLASRKNRKPVYCVTKRAMDIVGSAVGLLLCAPLFLLVAIAVKVTSRGPVFFRQERIGQCGVPFTFLKFRSMYVDNKEDVHREYVTDLIAGCAERKPDENRKAGGNGNGVFKLTQDPRVTPLGCFLRRTSLDELPQLFNVLSGEMSLVGPRPPIPYEVDVYQLWHRRRVLEAKPGITGLWQVSGRSRVKFDDMVRLDLRYAVTWSLWLDVKILLQTPGAVLLGEGAY